jgi:uncharacterized protein with von Willebrand factor type A (vWA) domain
MSGAPVLERLTAYVAALESALADPRWDGTLPAPVTPDDADTLDIVDYAAATALLARASAAHDSLEARLRSTRAEIETLDPRRSAARSYIQHGGPPRGDSTP